MHTHTHREEEMFEVAPFGDPDAMPPPMFREEPGDLPVFDDGPLIPPPTHGEGPHMMENAEAKHADGVAGKSPHVARAPGRSSLRKHRVVCDDVIEVGRDCGGILFGTLQVFVGAFVGGTNVYIAV